jgi:chromosome segregation ATPase
MSFKEKFPTVAAFIAKLQGAFGDVKAEDNFTNIELTAKQFDAIEAEMKTLGEGKETAEASLKTAQDELAAAKAEKETLKTDLQKATEKVTALEADVKAKDEKIAEFSAIAEGKETVVITKGEPQPDANATGELPSMNFAKEEGLI